MFRLNHFQEHEAYRAEMLRKAARRRAIREALAGQGGRFAFYAPMMVGLGRKMMLWGHALQARYTSTPEMTFALPDRSI
jgi:hypothetical protein